MGTVTVRSDSSQRDREAIELLENWTGAATTDTPQPLIFNEWLRQLIGNKA